MTIYDNPVFPQSIFTFESLASDGKRDEYGLPIGKSFKVDVRFYLADLRISRLPQPDEKYGVQNTEADAELFVTSNQGDLPREVGLYSTGFGEVHGLPGLPCWLTIYGFFVQPIAIMRRLEGQKLRAIINFRSMGGNSV